MKMKYFYVETVITSNTQRCNISLVRKYEDHSVIMQILLYCVIRTCNLLALGYRRQYQEY